VRAFCGQWGSSDADVRTFWCKKLCIFQNLWCVLTNLRGVEPVRTFCGQGRGVFAIFCGRLLWMTPNTLCQLLTFFVFLVSRIVEIHPPWSSWLQRCQICPCRDEKRGKNDKWEEEENGERQKDHPVASSCVKLAGNFEGSFATKFMDYYTCSKTRLAKSVFPPTPTLTLKLNDVFKLEKWHHFSRKWTDTESNFENQAS